MNDLIVPRGAEPRKLLQSFIDEDICAIMTYLSKGKWHVARVVLKQMGASRLHVQLIKEHRPHPVNIQANQPVGISVKYRYGKVVFDSTVLGFEPGPGELGGTIVLSMPDRVEIIQRRSYFRVNVPNSLKVLVTVWHRKGSDKGHSIETQKYLQGKLIDLSAGGLQVVVNNSDQPDFKKGQFVTLRFTPMPYEQPLMFSAQIRNTLSTADDKGNCLGMQIVGLEASAEGRETLQRLCDVVEQYYQLNQSGAKQCDVKAAK